MDEYKLLILILEFCEENGKKHENLNFSVNGELVEEIHKRYGLSSSIEELQKIVDRCYARDWLGYAFIGGGRYNGLKLTTKGVGIAISKRKAEEIERNRTLLKKFSDHIESHKGLFLLLGFLIASCGLILSFLLKG